MWYISLRKDILLFIIKYELLYETNTIYIANKNTLNGTNEFSLFCFGLLQADPRDAENGVGDWLKFAQNVITSTLKGFRLNYDINCL